MLGRYNGRRVAVKAMPRKDPQTQVEIAVSSRLQAHPHPHVIVTLPPVPSPDSKHIFLPMELADQDLLAHTDALGGLEECEASLLFLQVARGLRHLHGAGIYHLDVKPENVLMVGGLAKVSDFGTAHCCDPKFSHHQPAELHCFGVCGPERDSAGSSTEAHLTTKACGTSAYGCPEGLEHMRARKEAAAWAASQNAHCRHLEPERRLYYTPSVLRNVTTATARQATTASELDEFGGVFAMDAEKADVWALGITMFVTVTGFFP
jgi:serine/threonine protein kinase